MNNIDFNTKISKDFDSLVKKLENDYGLTYLAFFMESKDLGTRFNLVSNQKWYKLFIEDNLIDSCPLVKHGRSVDRTLLLWDNLPCSSKEEKEVCSVRAEHDIDHGVSFGNTYTHHLSSFKEFIGFAGERRDFKFPDRVLKNLPNINSHIMEFRRKVIRFALEYAILSDVSNTNQ